MKEIKKNNKMKKVKLNKLLKRLNNESLNLKEKERVQELFSRLNNGTSIVAVSKNNIFNFIKNFMKNVRRIGNKSSDQQLLNEIELEINSVISDYLSDKLFSKDFTRKKECEYNIEGYFQNSLRFEFSNQSLKVYDIVLTPKVKEQIKRRVIQEEVKEFCNGKDLETIKQDLEQTFNTKNEELLKKCKNTPTLEPYYGKIEFMSKRIKLIKNAMNRMLEHPEFNGRKDIQEYIAFCGKFDDINISLEGLSFEEQKQIYRKYEQFYISVLSLEEKLAPEVGEIWQKKFTKADKFSQCKSGEIVTLDKVLEDGKMAFFGHALGEQLFKPEDMNKACCVFFTEKTVTMPRDVGLIYPMNMENILTISPVDVGSWVIDKKEFLERGLPGSWQYTDAIDKHGNRMFFEDPPTYTKLFLPDDIENATIDASIENNGEMLNNDKYIYYNEIILLNKNKTMLPIAVFMKTEGTTNEKVLRRAKEVSEFYGLPILDVDLCYLRERQGLNALTEKQRKNELDYIN